MAAFSDVIFTTLFAKWPHKKTKIMFVINSYYSSMWVCEWGVGVGLGWVGGGSETELSLTGKKANRRGSGTWVQLAELDSKGPTCSSHLGSFPSHAQVPRDESTGPRMRADSAAWVGWPSLFICLWPLWINGHQGMAILIYCIPT